jgi:hypothetical protein
VEIIIPLVMEETSRPDLRQMLGDIVAEFGGSGGKRTGVVASEPDGMG